jgi:alpha-tubulin suppressor-like RCC1 family protein
MGTELGSFQSPQKLYLDDIRFVGISMSKSPDSFMAALDQDGGVYSWGNNQFGQLGLGDFRQRKVPSKVT